jgi:AcrR family transcriptional regulator
VTTSTGRSSAGSGSPRALPRPRKRPVQDRSKFTLQAIYDAYARIWRRDGPDAATTRAVAEEAGFAIGTLYEWFPNKTALHSGYVRHAVEALLARIDSEVIAGPGDWQARLHRLVEITCGADPEAPLFDAAMLALEGGIAEPKHHRRVFDELAAKWTQAIRAWDDLAPRPGEATIAALVLAVWGARRYRLLADPAGERLPDWVAELEALCRAALSLPSPRP